MFKILLKNTPKSLRYLQQCAKSSAESAKARNFENKALYGSVIKKKGKKKTSKNTEVSPVIPQLLPHHNESEMSSEMFWLTRNITASSTKDKHLKESASARHKHYFVQKNDNSNCRASVNNTTSLKIPFDDKELRSITHFPMHMESSNQNIWKPLLDKDHDKLPSVGKILQATMPESSRQALINWKLKQIAELGEDGFTAMQQSHLNRGSAFHECLNNFFKTKQVPPEDSESYLIWNSVNNGFLTKYNPNSMLSEAHIIHPYLKYKGIVDCVSQINDELCVIEWKKSEKRKPTINATYDAPIQLVAYLGALSADAARFHIISRGFVVIGYTDGQDADTYRLELNDLRKYWTIWTSRVQEYWIRYRDGTLPEPV